MPTLLQINVLVNSGSTGRIVEDIGQMVIKNGWKSYVVYGRQGGNSRSELIKIGNKKDIFLHGLETRLFDRQGLGSGISTRKFLKQLKKIKPDIVHLHNIHGYYLNYKLLFETLSKINIPLVWTLHDCWAFTGHCSYYSFVGCYRWKEGCFDCPQKRNYPATYFWDRSYWNYRDKKFWFTKPQHLTLVSVSDWLAGEVRNSFLGKYPIHRIYNGVDTEIFRPYNSKKDIYDRYGIRGNFLLLGVANVWDRRKGLDDFIRLRASLPEDVSVLLVGLTAKQIRLLPKGIIGIGRTESIEELAWIYAAADLFVNASVEETFGLTTVESLACGTPAVVYRSTACPELITPNVGFVVEPGNIEDIVQKTLVVREQGKSFYTGFCRQHAVEHFRKEDCYAEYIRLYEELLYQSK